MKAALAAILLALTLAAPAAADDAKFLNAARESGFTADDQSLLRDGYMVCAAHLKLGDDMTTRLIRRVWLAAGVQFDATKPALFLSLAKANLC